MTGVSKKAAKKQKEELRLKISREKAALYEYFTVYNAALKLNTSLNEELAQFFKKFKTLDRQVNQTTELMERLGFSGKFVRNRTKLALDLLGEICREFASFDEKTDSLFSQLDEQNEKHFFYVKLLEKVSSEFDNKSAKELHQLLRKDKHYIELDANNNCGWLNDPKIWEEWTDLKLILECKVIEFTKLFQEACLIFGITELPEAPDQQLPDSPLDEDEEDEEEDDDEFCEATSPLSPIELEKEKQLKKEKPKVKGKDKKTASSKKPNRN